MSIADIIAELQSWLEAHPDALPLELLKVRRAIRILEGIDE